MVPPSSFTLGLLFCSLAMPLPRVLTAEFLSRYNSDSGPGPFPDLKTGKTGHHSRLASDDDKHVEIYSNIIEMLGQLNVLTPHGRSCYVLHKIERIVNNSISGGDGGFGDGNTTVVEVRLFFTESVLTGSVTAKEGDVMSDRNGNSGGTGSEANDDTDNGDDERINRTRAECKKKQAYALWAAALTSNEKENAVNGSGSISAPSAKIENDSGLSHTQLVVIVTCSCIIGIFFLVAGIIRIRNYVNRLREEQAMAKRPTFRSCTVALRNSTGSSELLRRETLSSTSPSKGEDDRNSGGGDSIHSSPKQAGNTNNAKFLTTSASPKQESNKSSLQSPTSSIKYIDEDDTSKKESDTDEVEDEGESESKPLLACEVLSGKEDNKENGKGPVHFGNSLAFENFPNNNDVLPTATDTNEANLNPNISSMENNSYQPTGPPDPEVLWLEQAVEESTIGSVTAGLTQSDSSLSSGNKFYSYGTGQLEYVSPCQPNNGDMTSASSSPLSSPCSDKSPAITLQQSLGVEGNLPPGNLEDGPVKLHEVTPHPDICDNQPSVLCHVKQPVPEESTEPRHTSAVENAGQDPTISRHDNTTNIDNNYNNNPNGLPCNNVTVSSTTNTTTTTTSSISSSNSEPQPTGTGGHVRSAQGDTERDVVLVDVEGNYTHQTKNLLDKEDTVPLANANLERVPAPKESPDDKNRRDHPLPASTTTAATTSASPRHSTSTTSSPKAIPNVISSLPPMASRDTDYL